MKKILFLLICFFFGCTVVNAKEVRFYFYPSGGTVTTSGFSVGSYQYLDYNGTVYASYVGGKVITTVNSISGQAFSLSKSGSKLTTGKEWYFKYNGKTYFLNQSKSYDVNTLLDTIGANESNSLYSLDLYANWDSKVTSGTVVPEKKYKVIIKFHANKGTIGAKHDSHISIVNDYVYYNNSYATMSIPYGGSLDNSGLANYNNTGWINIVRSGYIAKNGAEWNTKADGSGKSYHQDKAYKASDFCDASKANCTVTLYVNWLPQKVTIKYHANGGIMAVQHSEDISIVNNYVHYKTSYATSSIAYGKSLGSGGLANYNNTGWINIEKKGFTAKSGAEWNTKADGSGKSFSQSKDYKASDFCDASKGPCEVVLYVNWVRNTITIRYHVNGGKLDSTYGKSFSIKNSYVYQNSKLYTNAEKYGDSSHLINLLDANNPSGLNLVKNGYYLEHGKEWNTKVDGSGKSFDQFKDYISSDFCNAFNNSCTTNKTFDLYANWKSSSGSINLGTVDLASKKNYYTVPHDGDIMHAQGFTVAGDYYIAAKRDADEVSTNIFAINMNTGKVVSKYNKKNYWGHANAIAYQSDTQKIYVAYTTNTKVKIFPYSNIGTSSLSLTEQQVTIGGKNQNPVSLEYDSDQKLFYSYVGGSIYVFDSELKTDILKFSKKYSQVSQDIGAYKGKVLVVRWDPRGAVDGKKGGKVDVTNAMNAVDVYSNIGKYLGSYIIKLNGELECVSYNPKKKTFAFYIQTTTKISSNEVERKSLIYEAALPNIDSLG